MKKQKLSGPAIFMYGTIVLTVLIAAICFTLYYSGTYKNDLILWCGIVSFMILYHFGLRILMGEVTKRFKINYLHPFYKERRFEKSLYKLLKVRKWKDKVLTFEPENYDFKNRTLEQLATTMSKSELDHWINEVISVFSILFIFIWGCPPAFLISAVAAMLFDAQFIIVQRYNRPVVLRLMNRKSKREKTNSGEKHANIS
ncbi:MAG: hypothetical protein E7598_00515 [Ruminococcaceae bacterium]|nr:hypothetical protein [Oscillospiraceae bacterium]